MKENKLKKFDILITLSLIAALTLFILAIKINYSSSSNTVTASVNVGNVIYLSVSPNSINFGNLGSSSSYYTNVLVTDTDNGGNIAANILVEGTNWAWGSNIILVGNTLWSSSSQSSYSGTALANTFTITNIIVPQPTLSNPSTNNIIYFGVYIPGGTPPGNYMQTITFEDENVTYGTYNTVSSSYQVTAYANVIGTCYISLSTNNINFNSIYASANVPTNVLVIDSDNGGNAAASLLISGGNWIYSTNSLLQFGVTNTLWNPSSLTTYSGNTLTSNLINTGITIPAPTQSNPNSSNNIYFGLGVPGGTPAGSYTQTIVIDNTC
ncbi:MAG: hypothetical protein ACP5T6_01785 [Candidatus Micrarchaeia archaeon]